MSNASDFLRKQQTQSYCGYLKTSQADGNTTYQCGHPSEKLKGMNFDEPCTTSVWDNCPLNLKIKKEEIISIVKNRKSLPELGQSVEVELPDSLKQYGTKYTIENKNGEYNVFKIDIYPSETLGKPPKVRINSVLD